MARVVYVTPVAIIGGMHWDLHGDEALGEQFDMVLSKVDGQAVNGFKVELVFDCPSSLVEGGRVLLNAEGDVCRGAVEAERSCMMKMVAAMRRTYGLSPADFNLIMFSERRLLFNAMKANIDAARQDFIDLHTLLSDCRVELARIAQSSSVWIGNNHPYVRFADVSVVSAFQEILRKHEQALDLEVSHAKSRCDTVLLRHAPPDGLAMLDDTVPLPMEISWEGSYHTLMIVYNYAMRKLSGGEHTINLRIIPGGFFRAEVEVPVPPHKFVGVVAGSQKAAMAKLFFAVIKYVNVDLGYLIMDLHTDVREYQDSVIDRFDVVNDNVMKCGQKLHQLFALTQQTYVSSVRDLVLNLDVCEATEHLLEAVHDVKLFFEAKKIAVDAKWNEMSARKITRAALEEQIA